jgi:hypothetical protein
MGAHQPHRSPVKRRKLKLVRATVPAESFTDPASERVLKLAAMDLARELGRQAAREHFARITTTKAP